MLAKVLHTVFDHEITIPSHEVLEENQIVENSVPKKSDPNPYFKLAAMAFHSHKNFLGMKYWHDGINVCSEAEQKELRKAIFKNSWMIKNENPKFERNAIPEEKAIEIYLVSKFVITPLMLSTLRTNTHS